MTRDAPSAAETVPGGAPDVVAFRHVTKVFGRGGERRGAIQDVSFAVADLPGKGELVTIVGPSGCG